MDEKEKVLQVFYDFEDGGLISKDVNKILSCITDTIIGIGIGEQGFVTSKESVLKVFEKGLKEDDSFAHHLNYGRIEVRIPADNMAVVCAEVIVTAESPDTVIESHFSQSLTMQKIDGDWKICGLHASTPVITEENIEAYPLKFAEKTLKSLKEKIGEEVYTIEEQYRLAVLKDTIAFYIINFTKNTYEKCQLNSYYCAYIAEGTPYEGFTREHVADYVVVEDVELYLERFSLENIFRAFDSQEDEVQCEYRMMTENGKSCIWVVTIIRLITDIVTGERKGIMYVKNIDSKKRQSLAMQERAEYDAMLQVYNRTAFISYVEELLRREEGVFLMLDLDNFKEINDTYGHPMGDKVLIYLAKVLKEAFPRQTVLGRLGGDEFGIYLPGRYSSTEICAYIDALFQTVAGYKLHEDQKAPISCSLGIAYAKNSKRFSEIYQNADAALYMAKQDGKGCFRCYDKDS